MIQMFRLPQSGASTCYVLSGKYYDRTQIYSQHLTNHGFLRKQFETYIFRSCINKKIARTKRNTGMSKRVKETELLKVAGKETTQTTMTLGKLNASHVAAFVEEPGMILKNVKNAKVIRDNRRNDLFSSVTLNLQKKNLGSKSSSEKEINDYKLSFSNEQNIVKSNVDSWEKNRTQYSFGNSSKQIKEKQEESVTTKDLSTHNFNNDFLSKGVLTEINSEVSIEEKESAINFINEFLKRKSREMNENPETESSPEHYLRESKSCKSSTPSVSSHADYLHDTPGIHPYIDVCVHCNLLDYTFNFLTQRPDKKAREPKIYQTLLRKFAEKGDWFQAQLLVNKMESFGVAWTPQTFALYLLSVANGETCDRLERTALILEKFREKGFQVDDLFTKTFLKIEEREKIIKEIHKILPHFDIPPTTVNLNSNCPLLENLHKNQQPLQSPAPFLNKEDISLFIDDQLSIEEDQICTIKKIGGNAKYSEKYRKIWVELNDMWEKNFRRLFESSLTALKTEFEKGTYKNHIYPYLLTLSSETFAQLAAEEMDKLAHLSGAYSECTYDLYKGLGHRVYQMYCKKKKTMNEDLSKSMKRQIEIYCRWYAHPSGPARNARQKWQMLMGDNPDIASAFMSIENVAWPLSVELMVGRFLYNIIFKSALIPGKFLSSKFKGEIPAFYLVLRQNNMKLREEVKFHPFLATIIKRANFNTIKFPAYLLPMLCPPKPWSGPDSGGYYFLSTELLRSHTDKINKDFVKSVPNQNLYAVFDALNKLQSVPWRINEEVLDVAIKIFNSGGSEELNVPVRPDMEPLAKIPRNLPYSAKVKLFKERKDILSKRQNEYGLWCEGLYKLSLANHFRKKVFWLPQNLDFRGRVYPVPPHVSHVSADLFRSFLVFAKKERLGERGLDWLKIHAINLTGNHKKKSLRERLEYANHVLPDIIDSAENPLNGRRWWVNSDDPWQTLGACFEIRKAIASGNPEMFQSGLPIHQDGSCNGLQHYAALGRDKSGAISVNLSPSEIPQDVYSDVANLLEAERAKDEAQGVEIAKLLNGFVSRKVVKRPVMTTVYGVTWFGAKLQIAGVLADVPDFPKNMIMPASSYLATKIFFTLRKLFTSAKEIQDWFNKCSFVIVRNFNRSVAWENPIGLPIIQPYFSKSENAGSPKPDFRKQKNAFAPNFIHSLDSSHMMLTALNCEPADITFASVHDCFWTHPSKVDVMNKICRENFVALHSQKVLQNLSQYFIKAYSVDADSEVYSVLTEIPKLGDFDLNTVKDSVYFFA